MPYDKVNEIRDMAQLIENGRSGKFQYYLGDKAWRITKI